MTQQSKRNLVVPIRLKTPLPTLCSGDVVHRTDVATRLRRAGWGALARAGASLLLPGEGPRGGATGRGRGPGKSSEPPSRGNPLAVRPDDSREVEQRALDQSEAAERKVYGPLPSTYRTMIGPTPNLRTGDRVAAKAFQARIEAAIDHGGWSKNENMHLHRLHRKWAARAEGLDIRFNRFGNIKRGLTRTETADVKRTNVARRILGTIRHGGLGR